MRIIQIINELIYGNAVTNHALAIKKAILDCGIETEIYMAKTDTKLPSGSGVNINEMPDLFEQDIIIYHIRPNNEIYQRFRHLAAKKIMIYHVFTDPKLVMPFDSNIEKATNRWIDEAKIIAKDFDYAIEPSYFDKQETISLGFPENLIDVVPYIIKLDDFLAGHDEDTFNKYSDGKINIIFIARIVPNKKQEDAIAAYAYYKKNINPKSRLILAGRTITEKYMDSLIKYTNSLGLSTEDVIFPGSVPFSHIISYYKVADIFLCSSEHEGFCIPLVEAMFMNVPIIAYNFTAIPDTLSGSGILLDRKDPILTAKIIDKLITDGAFKEAVLIKQRDVLKKYKYNIIVSDFLNTLKGFIINYILVQSNANNIDSINGVIAKLQARINMLAEAGNREL